MAGPPLARPPERTNTPRIAWSEVASRLRERNLRLTPQRRLVVDVLAGMEGHVTASQVLERCLERDPQVVPSTVYRTLDLLSDLGLVTHMHALDGREEFHPAGGDTHAHLVCASCGTRLEMTPQELDEFRAHVVRHHDFDVDISHMAIFGTCGACRRV